MDVTKSDFQVTQEFYGENYFVGQKTIYDTGYSEYSDGEWAGRQAALCLRYFRANSILEVGCATGFVANRLRQGGRNAFGMDYSHYAVTHSPAPIRPFLAQGSALILPYSDHSFELVVCLETLEHLWPYDVDQAIAELARVSSRWVFASIPSFGFNDFGPVGLEIGPHNLEDARANRAFQEIPMDPQGQPHHGHLTLATYRWWTGRFEAHGLTRLGWLERQINQDPDCDPALWQFYALQKDDTVTVQPACARVTQPYVIMGVNDNDQLGAGWYVYEPAFGARWTIDSATAYCLRQPGSRFAYVEYSYPAPLADRLGASVEIAGQTYPLPIARRTDGWQSVHLPLPDGDNSGKLSLNFHVRQVWTGQEVLGNQDVRDLGLAVRSICLVGSTAEQCPAALRSVTRKRQQRASWEARYRRVRGLVSRAYQRARQLLRQR